MKLVTQKLSQLTSTISLAIALLLLVAVQEKRAFGTTIDFESFPNGNPVVAGTPLTTQYGLWGVFFNPEGGNTPLLESQANAPVPAPHLGSTFEAIGPSFGAEFENIPFTITFDPRSPQSSVQLYGGSGCITSTGQLIAFGSAGQVVAADPGFVAMPSTRPLTQGQTSTLFSVLTQTSQIFSVGFQAFGPGETTASIVGCFESIDDLTFTGTAAPPASPPPTITLTAPPSGTADYTSQAISAAGQVSGTSLYELDIDLTSLNLPASVGSSTQHLSIAPLAGNIQTTTGTNIPYSFPVRAIGQLPVGNYTMVVTITDGEGQQAHASVDFANFPPAITGLSSGLGPFQFGENGPNCEMAFYQGGAIGYNPTNLGTAAIFVPSQIATKWQQVNALGPAVLYPSRSLGCPVGAAANNLVNTNPQAPQTKWAVQAFQYGTIYAPTGGAAMYVPHIFLDPMYVLAHTPTNAVGDEAYYIGWPASDPDWSLDTDDPSWVFQRFDQYGLGPVFQNTLEIRGRTPTLWVERIGGDLRELSEAQMLSNGQVPFPAIVDDTTPTIWQQFPCTMASPDTYPTSCDASSILQPVPPTEFSGAPFCNSDPSCDNFADGQCPGSCNTFSSVVSSPENWVDTGVLNLNATTYQGVIRALDVSGPNPGSHLASYDYPFDHENCAPSDLSELGNIAESVGLSLLNCTVGWVQELFGDSDPCTSDSDLQFIPSGSFCRSDWNMHTRPLASPTNWSFLSNTNLRDRVDMEIEFEVAWAADYFKQFAPIPGDLVTVHGRPVVDCAHCPFKAEIHPADMIVASRSFVMAPDQFTPLVDDTRVTDAYIWGNAFLPQQLQIVGPVYAPPRISIDAQLVVQHQENGYSKQTNMQATTQFITGGMQVTMTGPSPGVVVTSDGEWMFPTSNVGEFVDNWQLSWQE